MYKVFMVARGYPLGEILRQLGGGPPEPATNVRRELLQFQTLAQPNYRRWQLVQQAMINLNRLVVRIATYEEPPPAPAAPAQTAPTAAEAAAATAMRLERIADPLGLITEPDAWRIFLLHHWELIDNDDDAAPESLPEKLRKLALTKPPMMIKQVTDEVKRR